MKFSCGMFTSTFFEVFVIKIKAVLLSLNKSKLGNTDVNLYSAFKIKKRLTKIIRKSLIFLVETIGFEPMTLCL